MSPKVNLVFQKGHNWKITSGWPGMTTKKLWCKQWSPWEENGFRVTGLVVEAKHGVNVVCRDLSPWESSLPQQRELVANNSSEVTANISGWKLLSEIPTEPGTQLSGDSVVPSAVAELHTMEPISRVATSPSPGMCPLCILSLGPCSTRLCLFLRWSRVLGTFLDAVIKSPDESRLREAGPRWVGSWGHSPPRQESLETSSHISEARKQRAMNTCAR